MLWCTYPKGGHFENPHSKQAALEEAKPMEGSTDGVNNFLDGLNLRTLPGQQNLNLRTLPGQENA